VRLEGYRCDNCSVESKDKPGTWYEVVTANVSASGMMMGDGKERFPLFRETWEASYQPAKHYCSKGCLIRGYE